MEHSDTRFSQPRLTRRLALGAGLGTLGLALLGALGGLLGAADAALRTAARSARPAAAGASATRCARCGATDHAMLAGCPLDPLPRAPGLGAAGRPGSPDA